MVKTFNVSFPQELVKEVDRVAKQESMSRSEMLRAATKNYLDWLRDWRQLQRYGRERAKELGIRPKDIERLIDEVRADER